MADQRHEQPGFQEIEETMNVISYSPVTLTANLGRMRNVPAFDGGI